MGIKLRPYKKELDYSYAIGVFPTLELINHKPENVLKVVLNSHASTNKGAEKISDFCSKNNIKTEVSDGFINKIAGKENCYAAGVFKKYETDIKADQNHLVLVGIRDMGNLGTIARTMLGFNITNLAIIKPAADLFNPKAIRASMGAIFQLNYKYHENFGEYQKVFKNNKYCFLTDGKIDLNNVEFKKPYALVFGSEAEGLGESFKNIGTSVRINQSSKIDSLNLSVAVGIALFEAREL